jgi:hypothetical protein
MVWYLGYDFLLKLILGRFTVYMTCCYRIERVAIASLKTSCCCIRCYDSVLMVARTRTYALKFAVFSASVRSNSRLFFDGG